jgi:hypothetical protein
VQQIGALLKKTVSEMMGKNLAAVYAAERFVIQKRISTRYEST